MRLSQARRPQGRPDPPKRGATARRPGGHNLTDYQSVA